MIPSNLIASQVSSWLRLVSSSCSTAIFRTASYPSTAPDHLAIFLERFGVPKEAMPDGAVGRNLLLFRLYEAIGGKHQLGPADFAHVLYTHFEPRGVKLDTQRVRGASASSAGSTANRAAVRHASSARSATTKFEQSSAGRNSRRPSVSRARSRTVTSCRPWQVSGRSYRKGPGGASQSALLSLLGCPACGRSQRRPRIARSFIATCALG